jgi:hypothetical protein
VCPLFTSASGVRVLPWPSGALCARLGRKLGGQSYRVRAEMAGLVRPQFYPEEPRSQRLSVLSKSAELALVQGSW